MTQPRSPVFLERDLYRRRRVIDGAKLLPVLGIVLFIFPALLLDADEPGASQTSARLLFFFGAWLSLILIAFVLSRWLRPIPDLEDGVSETDSGR